MAQTGRHAFVTGGSRGIGLAIARALAQAGWQLTVAGRDAGRLRAAVDALPGAVAEPLDVTDADAVPAAIARAAEARGPVALLVNNAGGAVSAPFEKTDGETWARMIDLNLMGAVRATRAVLPGMRAAKWGRIVNVASTAGLVGYRYVSAYVAAKHALVGLTKALALEVAKAGITVNAVCPGYTDTEMLAAAAENISKTTSRTVEEARAALAAANPQGRLVKPEEVAAAVLWLASDGAGAINGVALPVAGGEVA